MTYQQLQQLKQDCLLSLPKKNVKEVVFKLITIQGNYVYYMRLKKDQAGEFKVCCFSDSFSSFCIKYPVYKIEWEADANNWSKVAEMIESGICLIETIDYR